MRRSGLQLPFNAKDIDYLLLTHAHIDHSGRIPLLIKRRVSRDHLRHRSDERAVFDHARRFCSYPGIGGSVAKQKSQTERPALVEPLYTVNDAYKSLSRFETIEYEEKRTIDEGITIRYQDAGHLLGSALIEL